MRPFSMATMAYAKYAKTILRHLNRKPYQEVVCGSQLLPPGGNSASPAFWPFDHRKNDEMAVNDDNDDDHQIIRISIIVILLIMRRVRA